MKKYNKSEIFTRAWELVKKLGYTISKALKNAWAEAKRKAEKLAFEESLKTIEKVEFTGYAEVECKEAWALYTFKRWTKYGKDRIYINYRNKRSVGYIDMKTGELCDFNECESACEALAIFKASYNF